MPRGISEKENSPFCCVSSIRVQKETAKLTVLPSYTVKKYAQDADFLDVLGKQDRGVLMSWFDKKLPKRKLRHLLDPFAKAVDMDYIFHPDDRGDLDEEVLKKELGIWCRVLCSSTATDVLQFAFQIKIPNAPTPGAAIEYSEPEPNWKQIEENLRNLRANPAADDVEFDWIELPIATKTFGIRTRADGSSGVRTTNEVPVPDWGDDFAVDNSESEEEEHA
jgi:hypothetical protein